MTLQMENAVDAGDRSVASSARAPPATSSTGVAPHAPAPHAPTTTAITTLARSATARRRSEVVLDGAGEVIAPPSHGSRDGASGAREWGRGASGARASAPGLVRPARSLGE